MSSWNDPYLKNLFKSGTPLIDVRAPVEFSEGKIPHSVNLPILDNEQRAKVGTCFKNNGQDAAISLGHELIAGEVKDERIASWINYLRIHPRTQIFCFRGGLRSQITCQWLRSQGFDLYPIEGGYKRMRKFFISFLEEASLPDFIRLGGLTGSGKTRVLKQITPHIDLEEIANHKGSAFGNNGPQPSQTSFENQLAIDIMNIDSSPVWAEDESITLGKITIPKRIFSSLSNSPLVLLKVDHQKRLLNIFEDYVQFSTPDFFFAGLDRIVKRLGDKKCIALKEKIKHAYTLPLIMDHHAEWISSLLTDYYDPLYQKAINDQKDKIIFEGNEDEILEFSRKASISN